jgi:hypothetical protein
MEVRVLSQGLSILGADFDGLAMVELHDMTRREMNNNTV